MKSKKSLVQLQLGAARRQRAASSPAEHRQAKKMQQAKVNSRVTSLIIAPEYDKRRAQRWGVLTVAAELTQWLSAVPKIPAVRTDVRVEAQGEQKLKWQCSENRKTVMINAVVELGSDSGGDRDRCHEKQAANSSG